MPLNERQKKFADYYIESLNAEQSAIKAGYSERTARGHAHKLLQNVAIKEYIEERMEEHKTKRIADQEEILQFLSDVIRGKATGRLKVGVGGGAEEVIDEKPSMPERIRAAEQLGKRYGMWTDKVEQTNTNLNINVGEWDDD